MISHTRKSVANVAFCVLEMEAHCLRSSAAVAGANGFENALMRLDGIEQGMASVGVAAAADLNTLPQRNGHGFKQVAKYPVATGQGNRLMKAHVEIVKAPIRLRIVCHGRLSRVPHALQCALDGSDGGAAGPFGRQSGALYLQ